MKKKTIKLKENYMDCIFAPEEHLNFKKNTNNTIVLDLENKGFFNKFAQKFFNKPKISHITLDQHGSVLWELMDGKKTVYDIVRLMEENFPDEKDDMLKRSINFFILLERYKFIIRKDFEKEETKYGTGN